jgi:hypothetical protein
MRIAAKVMTEEEARHRALHYGSMMALQAAGKVGCEAVGAARVAVFEAIQLLAEQGSAGASPACIHGFGLDLWCSQCAGQATSTAVVRQLPEGDR